MKLVVRLTFEYAGYAMTTPKFISLFFTWIVLTFMACSATTKKAKQVAITNLDTSYSTSTKQLKSNKIPDSVFRMTKLRHLAISGMDCDYGDKTNCWDINEIPAGLKNLKDLKTLRLTVDAIASIPLELTELKNLKLFDLSDNAGLTSFDNIAKCQSLEYLYLYGCGLTKLPDNIGDLKNLKELGLVGNNLDNTERTRITKALPNCIIKF